MMYEAVVQYANRDIERTCLQDAHLRSLPSSHAKPTPAPVFQRPWLHGDYAIARMARLQNAATDATALIAERRLTRHESGGGLRRPEARRRPRGVSSLLPATAVGRTPVFFARVRASPARSRRAFRLDCTSPLPRQLLLRCGRLL